jgi:hypothetical protein
MIDLEFLLGERVFELVQHGIKSKTKESIDKSLSFGFVKEVNIVMSQWPGYVYPADAPFYKIEFQIRWRLKEKIHEI